MNEKKMFEKMLRRVGAPYEWTPDRIQLVMTTAMGTTVVHQFDFSKDGALVGVVRGEHEKHSFHVEGKQHD